MRTNSGMNANYYCFAPPPHYSSADTPHTKPPVCSASDRDALLKEKATSTGQHRDQYW